MAMTRTKPNVNNELFHQRYSELGDDVRAKNKREDRLLDIRLKYYEREKNIRLNILRKEQHHLERTRSTLIEQLNRIQYDKYRQLIPSYLREQKKSEVSLVQLSTPDFFNTDWEQPISNTVQTCSSIVKNKPPVHTNIIRPHSAG
ncbi:hypothetical protein I4U23_028681 [Adineta vaga]|nr:hypothetical protein I4U23_028681 [Adineta vaga]